MTFLQDVETQVRLLIAAPLLILAEVRVHRVLPQIVGLFVERGLIPDAARSQFDAAIASAMRLRNSVVPELLLIVFVYSVGVPFVWRDQLALNVTSWYATVEGGHLQPSLAGWWVALVSMPVIQFLVVRWYFRFFIWARFLWQFAHQWTWSRRIRTAPPDCTFSPERGSLTPGAPGAGHGARRMMANRIFYEGAKVLDFKVEVLGTVGLLVFVILGPLLVFTPQLQVARRKGMEEYGSLGQQYAREFNRKWLRGGRLADQPPLGSADIQSLADLRNGYQVVEGIRLTPFGMKTVICLAVIMLLPVAPLLLTTFSVEQLLDRVLKVLF